MSLSIETRLLKVHDVIGITGMGESTIRKKIAAGDLPATKIGREWRIDREDLEAYIQRAGAPPGEDEKQEARRVVPELVDPVERMAAELNSISPRVAALYPGLSDRYEVVSGGEHFARFTAHFCRHIERVEDGPELGTPIILESFQREFFDELLDCDDAGRRIYRRGAQVIPRKNAKTTGLSMLALYMASPADGEARPECYLAAGALKQAGKLYGNAKGLIDDEKHAGKELRAWFIPRENAILCPSIVGKIEKLAGDGDSNHSLNPHFAGLDELHTWKTPKQKENWRALTTAQGGRRDALAITISTEGQGDENELALLLERIETSAGTEREKRRPGLTIFRNRDSGMLAFIYAADQKATLADLDEFEKANPASWRTRERIRVDLADPFLDDASKLRLYGNIRQTHANRWISDAVWAEAYTDEPIPDGSTVVAGADGARTRDTTAVAWAWKNPAGEVVVDAHVWTTRPVLAVTDDVTLVPGRLDNDLARDFIRDELMERFQVQLLLYDERYFADQADDLATEDELTTVELYQGQVAMEAAWNEFYGGLHEGETPTIRHVGGEVLRDHVRKAQGMRTARGWRVTKLRGLMAPDGLEYPIDALAAAVMARYGAAHPDAFQRRPATIVSWS